MKTWISADIRKVLWISIIAALIAIYTWGVLRQAFVVNLNPNKTDQGAYLTIAAEFERSNLTYVSPRLRAPLYMVLGSTVIKASMPLEDAFVVGKIFNIALSFVVIGIILLLFMFMIDPLFGGVLAALAAFTVVGYRAGYFQCEMLYGFLFLLFFAFAFEMFRRRQVGLAVAAGVIGAVGHLTKASLILGVWLAIGCALLIAAYEWLPLPWRKASPGRGGLRAGLTLPGLSATMFAAFFATGSPYFLKTKEMHGRYFFNYSTDHYIWYESWKEVKEKTAGLMDQTKLRTMKDYLAEKSPAEILARFQNGFRVFVNALFIKYSIGSVFVVLALGIIVLAVVNYRNDAGDFRLPFSKLLKTEHFFAAAMLGVFLVAYLFHAQMLPFPRFFIALALPAYYWLGLCAKDIFGARKRDRAWRCPWVGLSVIAGILLLYELRFRWLPLTGRDYFGQ